MEFIKFKNVEKTYKNGVNAVYDMNLDIKKGEFVFQWWFREGLWWFEQWVKPAVSNKPVLFIEPMLSMPQPGVGLLQAGLIFEMHNYPELSTETVGNFSGFAY